MSYSTILILRPASFLKFNEAENFRKQKRKVVCCCPWSGSGTVKNKRIDAGRRYKNTSSENLKVNQRKDYGNNAPFSLSDVFLSIMENQFPFNLITFLFSLGPFSSNESPNRALRLPPGPTWLHLMGHLPPYLIRSLPYHYPLRDLAHTYGPLMHIKLGELALIIVSSADVAKEVLKTHDVACSDRPKTMTGEVMCYNYSDILFSPYGHYWREMRKLCSSELLGAKRTRLFEHIREDEACALVESIESTRATPFNLTERMALCIGSMTSRSLIGKMAKDESAVNSALGKVSTSKDAIVKSVKKATSFAGHLYLTDLFPSVDVFKMMSLDKIEMWKLRRDTEKVLDYVIDEHRRNLAATGEGSGELGSEDLVDVLLRLKESDEFDIAITDDNIKAVISDMAVGGSETVLTTLDWAMAELMKNPGVMAKAQAEIRRAFKGNQTIQESEIGILKYLKLVVKETLRLHPPNCIIPRACREEFEIDGYHIPLNAVILVNVWAIGRDPKRWQKNPESFIPERFEENPIDHSGTHFEYIPFGSGKRMCPGIAFGIAAIELILARLLYHFDWKLPPGVRPDDLDMSESDGAAVSRKTSLYLIAKPYHDQVAIR
ncbi:hypothetical protein ACS0TY_012152 [Phlomoides rotata]